MERKRDILCNGNKDQKEVPHAVLGTQEDYPACAGDDGMKPNTIILGDALTELRRFPHECIDSVITSPPYWGLRDYGVVGQLGLEKTPEGFVKNMVEIFGEIRRVLKKEGTFWLNIGDSYAAGGMGGQSKGGPNFGGVADGYEKAIGKAKKAPQGMKPKDLVGIPWMLAFALRSDGWYLRQDIIWHKPNPMPESVTDRCTKAHEYVFMLSKSSRYYYDADAIKTFTKEPRDAVRRLEQQTWENKNTPDKLRNGIRPRKQDGHGRRHNGFNERYKNQKDAGGNGSGFSVLNTLSKKERPYEMANKRSVWSVNTMPFSEAHFATFPEKLIEPMILAGTPPRRHRPRPIHGRGDHRTRCKKTRAAVSRYRIESGVYKNRRETYREHTESPFLI